MSIGPLMLDLETTVLTAAERELLAHPLVGGVIFFARNYHSPVQIEDLCQQVRGIRPELLLAVDQEGGRVQRFKEGFTRIPAMQRFLPLYRKNPQAALSLVKDAAWLMASELLAVGIDFSFGPVLDLDQSSSEVIADRAFSDQVDEVVDLAGAWMSGVHEAGMATVGKHFPGHGGVVADSHLTLPTDGRSLEEVTQRDMQPFLHLQDRLDGIMPAHILFPQVDSQQPVGFSSLWLQGLLRQKLNFTGVIFSDDLSMEGAAGAGAYRYSERARLALQAGCDMVLACNHRQGVLDILGQLDVDLSAAAGQRLASIKAKQTRTWSELATLPRWQGTRQLLTALTQA